MPKEHRQVNDKTNLDLWNELMVINSNFPNDEIRIDHVIKDLGNFYAIDMQLSCDNPIVQDQLNEAYLQNMRLPRFKKHEHFIAMVSNERPS